MSKEPKLATCTFLKQWRGHAKGDVADLTAERAEELLGDGTCVEGEKKLTAGTKAADAKSTPAK